MIKNLTADFDYLNLLNSSEYILIYSHLLERNNLMVIFWASYIGQLPVLI